MILKSVLILFKEEVENKSYEEFIEDKKTIGYVERQLEKIGEAISQIQKNDSQILLKAYDSENIKGVRNRLIHEYWGTSLMMLYEISKFELDELKELTLRIRDKIKNNSFE